MSQPLIVAISEQWGLYANRVTSDPLLTRRSMSQKAARDYVRRAPADQRPVIVPSLAALAQQYPSASPQPLALYRLGQSVRGKPAGCFHRFTLTPEIHAPLN